MHGTGTMAMCLHLLHRSLMGRHVHSRILITNHQSEELSTRQTESYSSMMPARLMPVMSLCR